MAAEANLILQRQHAAVILARQAALRVVKRQIQREGRIKLGSLPFSTLSRLAIEWLDAHPELLSEAELSPIVQNLRIPNRRRRPDPKRELVCKSQVQNGARANSRSPCHGP
jgi:hypothetical protein